MDCFSWPWGWLATARCLCRTVEATWPAATPGACARNRPALPEFDDIMFALFPCPALIHTAAFSCPSACLSVPMLACQRFRLAVPSGAKECFADCRPTVRIAAAGWRSPLCAPCATRTALQLQQQCQWDWPGCCSLYSRCVDILQALVNAYRSTALKCTHIRPRSIHAQHVHACRTVYTVALFSCSTTF